VQLDNFAKEYQTETNEQLSRLADFGPPLPSDVSSSPWRPRVAGLIAFFFGPVGGALVVVSSLRRMGYQQRAKKVMLLALGAAVIEAAVFFFTPQHLTGLVGFCAEIAFLLVFPVFMEVEFNVWQETHPGARPCSGWSAIGWGLAGTILFVLIYLLVSLGLSPLFPAGQ
jgi:hypothetical protein